MLGRAKLFRIESGVLFLLLTEDELVTIVRQSIDALEEKGMLHFCDNFPVVAAASEDTDFECMS